MKAAPQLPYTSSCSGTNRIYVIFVAQSDLL